MKEYLQKLEPSLLNFDTVIVLDSIDVADYSAPVINNNYVLIKIQFQSDDNDDELHQKILAMDEKFDESYVYLLAFNRNSNAISFERFSVYLHNKYWNSLDNEYFRIGFFQLDMESMEWKMFYRDADKTSNCNLILISDFNMLFSKPGADEPSMDDFDIQLIMSRIRNSNCLMLGLNEYLDRYENPKIESFNYRNNSDMEYSEHLQQHEKEIIDRLLAEDFYESDDPVDALTDLEKLGRDVNAVRFTDEPRTAIVDACTRKKMDNDPNEILLLRMSKFETRTELNYPVEKDFILKNKNSGESYLYCHKGCIERFDYRNFMDSVLIPSELCSFFLDHFGMDIPVLNNDLHNFMNDSENFKTSIIKSYENNDTDCHIRNYFSQIEAGLLKFNLFCFLNIEVFDGNAWWFKTIIDDRYVFAHNLTWPPIPGFFFNNAGKDPKLSYGVDDELKFILGCRSEDFDPGKFRMDLEKLKTGTNPCPLVYNLENDEWIRISDPGGEGIRIEVSNLKNIIGKSIK